MQKLKLDKKTCFYLSFYVILAVEAIFIIPYQTKKLINLRFDTAALKKNIAQFNQDINSKEDFIEEKEIIKKHVLSLERKIITFQDISTVSAYISNKAKENAVDIKEISPDKLQSYKTTPEGKFSYLPIKIEAKASFHNLAQFFNALERGGYFLETKELAIKGQPPYYTVSMVVCALLKE